MRDAAGWKPSKYTRRRGRLIASRDPREVGVSSRLSADLVAARYDAALKKHARGRLLDLGCGKVPLYFAYKDHIEECICADWANTLHKSPHLDVVCDLSTPLPFCGGGFDTIVLSSVLEHVPEPSLLWREMSRVLAPGGSILMYAPFYYSIHEEPHDYYRYTEFALRRFASGSGLHVVELACTGGALEIMCDILSKNVEHAPLIGRPLAVAGQWLTGRLHGTPWGRCLSDKTGRKFPLGYFLVAVKA